MDGSAADWPLLLAGGGNSPGNIRIAQAAPEISKIKYHGFSREEVVERAENFIEYAVKFGAPVAGSTGAQGDAPKFLLTQDAQGLFHADGALADHLAVKHWLVKFPRGKQESDRAILRNESAYYRVAGIAGLNVGNALEFQENTLFVPRFDRQTYEGKVIRHGLESLCSVLGRADFGIKVSLEELCAALAKYSSNPRADIREFVLRDVLNVAMGNTDNHARNSSMIKNVDGTVRLAPLYDFAPMFLDDQGIPRTCRWTKESGGFPDWGEVAESLKSTGIDTHSLRTELSNFAGFLQRLPEIMYEAGVDDWLIQRLSQRITETERSLYDASPK